MPLTRFARGALTSAKAALAWRFSGWLRDRQRLALLKAVPEGSVCAEIGVHEGDYSALILKVARPRRLHLIDPWRYESDPVYKGAIYGGGAGSQEAMDRRYRRVLERFRPEMARGQVVVHRLTSAEAAAELEDGYLDWIYIDGNHQYEFARQDLSLYHPKLKDGGYLAGDDYAEGGWWKGGVKKAVDEHLGAGCCRLLLARHSQFVLQKRPPNAARSKPEA